LVLSKKGSLDDHDYMTNGDDGLQYGEVSPSPLRTNPPPCYSRPKGAPRPNPHSNPNGKARRGLTLTLTLTERRGKGSSRAQPTGNSGCP
jgi:hypothetical protein